MCFIMYLCVNKQFEIIDWHNSKMPVHSLVNGAIFSVSVCIIRFKSLIHIFLFMNVALITQIFTEQCFKYLFRQYQILNIYESKLDLYLTKSDNFNYYEIPIYYRKELQCYSCHR